VFLLNQIAMAARTRGNDKSEPLDRLCFNTTTFDGSQIDI